MKKKADLAQKIYDYHIQKWKLPKLANGVEWINPFDNPDTQSAFQSFFEQYYTDNRPRIYLLGINPGRHGAGVTGVAFTDPIRLENECGIPNPFKKRQELSSAFVYEVIEAYGGVESFYQDFAISSVSPLGFIKSGKNYNYYDDATLYDSVEKFIEDHLLSLKSLGAHPAAAISMGMGKNFKYLKALNKKLNIFGSIHPLPHPRWVMQYKLKDKLKYIDEYVELLHSLKSAMP